MSPDGQNQIPEPGPREERRATTDNENYFNAQFREKPVYLEPGQIVCSAAENEMYVARVGSGVLVTMHDTELKIGAMSYVLIPQGLLESFPYFEKADAKLRALATKPIEACIAEMKHKGAGKHRIQMRLIGGGAMPGQGKLDVGTKNYIFVREYIARKGLSILNEDLGGAYVRRVHFFPSTGRAVRMMMRRASDFAAVQGVEEKFQNKI
jgi:chemotaxis protein CheD